MPKYQCEYCGHESDYASVILDCEERCERDDHNTRGWYSRMNPHRKD